MTTLRTALFTTLGVAALTGTAFGDAFAPQQGAMVTEDEAKESEKTTRPTQYETPTGPMFFPSGWAFTLGGGYTQFADSDTRDFTSGGPSWEARVSAGTRWPFAVELAYIGGHNSVEALGLDDDGEAHLTSNGVELGGRWNILPESAIQPYLALGAGWKRYDMAEAAFNTSSVDDKDDIFEVPASAGVAFKWRRLLLDIRGTYRHAFADDLIMDGEGSLHNYQASGRLGLEF